MGYLAFNATHRRGVGSPLLVGGAKLAPGADMRIEDLGAQERFLAKKGVLLVKDENDPTPWSVIADRGVVVPPAASAPAPAAPPPEPVPPPPPPPEPVAPEVVSTEDPEEEEQVEVDSELADEEST